MSRLSVFSLFDALCISCTHEPESQLHPGWRAHIKIYNWNDKFLQGAAALEQVNVSGLNPVRGHVTGQSAHWKSNDFNRILMTNNKQLHIFFIDRLISDDVDLLFHTDHSYLKLPTTHKDSFPLINCIMVNTS